MWKFLEDLFSIEKKSDSNTSAKTYSPEPIDLLLSSSGRINFKDLSEMAKRLSKESFVKHIKVPMLVGSTVLAGKIASQKLSSSTSARYRTQFFSRADLTDENTVDSDSLKKSIYPIMHNPLKNRESTDIISLGRTTDNDLVMPDFSISEIHARIIIENDIYYLQDAHSTNGTTLNDKRLEEDMLPLNDQAKIQFSRYEFKILFPESLFDFISKHSSK